MTHKKRSGTPERQHQEREDVPAGLTAIWAVINIEETRQSHEALNAAVVPFAGEASGGKNTELKSVGG